MIELIFLLIIKTSFLLFSVLLIWSIPFLRSMFVMVPVPEKSVGKPYQQLHLDLIRTKDLCPVAIIRRTKVEDRDDADSFNDPIDIPQDEGTSQRSILNFCSRYLATSSFAKYNATTQA